VTEASLPDATPWWARMWLPFGPAAPHELSQPINPGWAFGNVIINERNSSSPATEAAILAEQSYGRQIGKLLDAVAALIDERPDAVDRPAYAELLKLRDSVERTKCEAAARRIDQIRRDLALLEATDPALYEETVAALRAVLPRSAAD